jgi:hypothetical protein
MHSPDRLQPTVHCTPVLQQHSVMHNQTGINFTNTQLLGNVTGLKFNDLNANGVQDVSEGGLSGWVINLKYPNGTVYATRTTPANGSFMFANIPWGTYTLSETLQSGWKQTKPTGNQYSIVINCTSLNLTGRDFGNVQDIGCCSCPTFAFLTTQYPAKPSPSAINRLVTRCSGPGLLVTAGTVS